MKKDYMNSRRFWCGLAGLLSLLCQISCDDSDIVRRMEPKIEIQEMLFTGPSASRQVVPLHSTYPWFAEASDSWVKLQRYRGQSLKPDSIVAEIEENPDMKSREGWIEIRLMDQMSTRIPVKQNGRGSLITLSKKLIYFNVNGGEATLDVITDLDWNTDVQEANGFTFTKVDKNHLKVKAAKNTTGGEIKKTVTLTSTEGTTKAELTVIQSNVEKMLSISLSEQEKDIITEKGGKPMEFPVSLNVPYECVASESWIKVKEYPPFSGDIVQDIKISLTVDPNDGDEERNGYIVVRNTGTTVEVSDTLYIAQRAFGRIVYVKAGSTGDGTSWERAFGTVEEGLAACTHYGDEELWIAAGEYQLKNWTEFKKVNIYGGFKGIENKVKDRDLSKKSTLIAAPANTWPSIYAYEMYDNIYRYVDGFIFTGSKASQGEGSLAVYKGWTFRNCIITNNATHRDAGGSYTKAKLINCLIYKNITLTTSSIVNAQGSQLYNVTIVNNESSGSSAGLRIGSSNSAVYNSIVWGNVHKTGTNHQVYLDANQNARFDNCAVQGGFSFNGGNKPSSTNGCITLNTNNSATDGPCFVDVSAANYQLQDNSPLINAGSNTAVQSLGLLQDILGNKRIWGDKVDIGAFEYFTKNSFK